jgi:hypothetical protein
MEEFVCRVNSPRGLGLGLRVDLGLELVDLEVPGPHLVSIGSQGGGGARARIWFEALPAGLGGLSVVELVAALYRQPGRDARVAVT